MQMSNVSKMKYFCFIIEQVYYYKFITRCIIETFETIRVEDNTLIITLQTIIIINTIIHITLL